MYNNDILAVQDLSDNEVNKIFGEQTLVKTYLQPGQTTLADIAMKLNCFPNSSMFTI